MPRRKAIDPLVLMMNEYATAPVESVRIIHRILSHHLSLREPATTAVPKPRRKRQTKPMGPATVERQAFLGGVPAADFTPELINPPAAKQTRKRKMRAGSRPPANEATPIVPLLAEVGGDVNEEAYTGN